MGDFKSTNNPFSGMLQKILDSEVLNIFRTDILANTTTIETNATDIATNTDAINTNTDVEMDNAMDIAKLDAGINLEMINGFKDAYEDESGVDTVASIEAFFDSANKWYRPSAGFSIETKLMLHMNGDDESTTFTDSSQYAHVMTAVNQAKIDTTVKKWGTGSSELDGTGDYLSTPDSADWDFWTSLTEDWAIDFWVYHDAVGGGLYIQQGSGTFKYNFRIQADNSLLSFVQSGGYTHYCQTSASAVTTGQWYHIAMIKVGTATGIYINGVQKAFHTLPSAISSIPAELRIGEAVNGNMDEVRISKGNPFSALPNAGKTDTITVPTAEYVAGEVENMTLISEKFPVDSAPTTARMLFKIEEVDSLELDTDIVFYLSRDDDSNRVQGTPELLRIIGSDKLIGVDFDLSEEPSDTDLVYRIVSHNNKTFYAKAIACQIK